MTTITGGLTAGITYAANSKMPQQSMSNPTVQWTARSGLPLLGGARVKNQPTPLQTQQLVGGMIAGLGADIFNRIWITPMVLDFGDITLSTNPPGKYVRLWNAFPRSKQEITSLEVIGDPDVEVIGITTPATLAPMAETVFEVIAGPFGQENINAYIPVYAGTPAVPLGDVGNIQIIGKRLEYNLPVLQFTPAEIDFGYIPSGSTVNELVQIWNADPVRSMTISSISVADVSGVRITDVSFPLTIPPLGTSSFTVMALPEGAQLIAGLINVSVSTLNTTYQVGVYGARNSGAVLPIVPNWSSPVNVMLSYSTDINTARDGTEQRRALRQTPRRTVSFMALLYGTNGQAVRTILRKWTAGLAFLADPTRVATLTEGVPTDTNQLTLNSVPTWLAAGAYVILVDGTTTIYRKVSAVSGNTVTFTDVSNNAWSSQTTICMCLYGRLSVGPQIQVLTDGVATFPVSFEVEVGSETGLPPAGTGPTYDGREILDVVPQWSSALTDTFTWDRDTVDFGFGLVDYYMPTAFGVETRQVNLLCDGTTLAAEDVIDFFCRKRGQWGEFFASTYQSDITIAKLLEADASQFTAAGDTLFGYYGSDTTMGRLAFLMDDGTMAYRAITALALDENNNTTVTLDYGVGDGTAIVKISWLNLSRFASDSITVAYLTTTVATTALTVSSRPYSPAEG